MSPLVCAWCGAPATDSMVVEPAEYKSVKGVKTCVHPERRVPTCCACATAERELKPDPKVVRAQRAATTKKWRAAQESLL